MLQTKQTKGRTCMIQVGDIVARKSYECDVLFRVIDIKEQEGKKKRSYMEKMFDS